MNKQSKSYDAETAQVPAPTADRALLRMGAVLSVLGLVLGVVVTVFFHGGTPPENLLAILPQFAANDNWELVHLAQFVADILLLVGYVALYRSITAVTEGVSAALARLGIIVAVV